MNIIKVAYVEAEGLDHRDMELVQALIIDEQAGTALWIESETTDSWLEIEFNADSASLLVAADIITEDELWELYDAGVTLVELYI